MLMDWLEPVIEKRVEALIEKTNQENCLIEHIQVFSKTFTSLFNELTDKKAIDLLYKLENDAEVLLKLSSKIIYRAGMKEGIELFINL